MSLLWDSQGRIRGLWVACVFAVVAIGVDVGVNIVLAIGGLWKVPNLDSPLLILSTAPTLLAGFAATLITWFAFREETGLGNPRPYRPFGVGFGLGAFTLAVSCGVPLLVGATSLSLTSRPAGEVLTSGLVQLATLAPSGVGEELLLRGLGFQALRRTFGDVLAVAITSLVFGALHLFNPGATWVAALLVALVGAWFATVTVRTGTLWTAMGLHVSWNFFEGFVFGQPVSGNPPGSSVFVAGPAPAPGFWSGGAFGPEAAGWTAVVLAAALVLTLLVPLPRRSAALT